MAEKRPSLFMLFTEKLCYFNFLKALQMPLLTPVVSQDVRFFTDWVIREWLAFKYRQKCPYRLASLKLLNPLNKVGKQLEIKDLCNPQWDIRAVVRCSLADHLGLNSYKVKEADLNYLIEYIELVRLLNTSFKLNKVTK